MTDFMGTFVCTFGYFDFLDFYFSRKPINRSTNLGNNLIDNQARYQSSFIRVNLGFEIVRIFNQYTFES